MGWHNGSSAAEPAGYGLKISAADRDRAFDREWTEVILELDGGGEATIALSPSFWRSCSELRSAEVGRWLLAQEAAPWPSQSPPGIALNQVSDNRFSARVIVRRSLL